MNRLICLAATLAVFTLAGVAVADNEARFFDSSASGNTWDNATTMNWGTVTGGPYNATTFGSYNIGTFEGIGGVVNSAGTNVNGLNFTTNGYNIQGGNLTLGSPGGGTFINVTGGNNATITSNIFNAGGNALMFRKEGAGTLTLQGEVRSDERSIQVNGGTLAVTGNGSLYSGFYSGGGNITVQNGATLELDNWAYNDNGNVGNPSSTSLGGLRFESNAIVINNGTIRVNGVGDSSYTRGLTINAGGATLEAAGGEAWILEAGGATNTLVVNGNGSLNLSGAGNGTLDKIFYGGGSLTKNGTGTWTLTQANTHTGNTTINQGVLALTGGENRIATGSNITVNAGGTLDIQATNAIRRQSPGTDGTITLNGGTLLHSAGNHAHIGNITLQNGALWTATSPTNFQGENVRLNGDVTVSGTSASTIGPFTAGIGLNGNRTFNVADVTGNANTDLLVSATLVNGGTGGIIKTGAGTMVMTAANTYTGDTVVNGGVLGLNRNQSNVINPNSLIIVNAGGTLDVQNTNSLNRNAGQAAIILNGGTLLHSAGNHAHVGNITLQNGALWTATSGGNYNGENVQLDGDVTVSGTSASTIGPFTAGIGLNGNRTFNVGDVTSSTATDLFVYADLEPRDNGTGGVIKTGAGTMSVFTAPTYTGTTTVNGGTLELVASGNTLSTYVGGDITINNGSTFRVSTNGSGGGLQYWFNDKNFIFGNSGGNTLDTSNTALNLVVYGGSDFITNGGTTNFITGSAGINLHNSDIANFNVADGSDMIDLDVSARLWNAGGINKTGAGTMRLSSNSNSFTGPTSVNQGTLIVSGSHNSASNFIAGGAVLELNVASGNRDYGSTTFTGTGTLRKTGAGTAYWGGSSANFALGSGGLIDVQEGTFIGGSSANEVWTNNLANLNVASGALFNGVEANVRVGALSGGGTIRTGYPGAGYNTFTFGVGDASGTFAGTLSHNNGVAWGHYTKVGTGTQVFTGTINQIADGNGLGMTISQGTVELGGNGTFDGGSWSNALLNNGTFHYNTTTNNTMTGLISGTGNLIKGNSGNLTLTQRNTYSGDTIVNGGTLTLNAANAATSTIGTGKLIINNGGTVNSGVNGFGWTFENPVEIYGGTLNQLSADSHMNTILLQGGTLGGAGEFRLHRDVTTLGSATTSVIQTTGLGIYENLAFNVADGNAAIDLQVSSRLNGASTLTKTGAGVMAINSNGSTFTGNLVVQQGTLLFNGGANQHPVGQTANRTITVGPGATLTAAAGAHNPFGTQAEVPHVIINGGTMNTANYQHMQDLTLTGALVQPTSAGTQVDGIDFRNGPTVTSNASATTSVIASKMTLRDQGAAGGVTFNVADGAANTDLLLSGQMVSSGDLIKNGLGVLAATADNTYTGETFVNEGTFVAEGMHTGAGNYFIASGATVGGNADIQFAPGQLMTVSGNPGIISPGYAGLSYTGADPTYSMGMDPATVGTFSLSASDPLAQALQMDGILQIDTISKDLHDLLDITGTATIGGPNSALEVNGVTDYTQLDFTALGFELGDRANLLTADEIFGNFANFAANTEFRDAAGNYIFFGNDGTSIFFQSVPEPGSLAVWGLLGAAMLGYLRRRRRGDQ